MSSDYNLCRLDFCSGFKCSSPWNRPQESTTSLHSYICILYICVCIFTSSPPSTDFWNGRWLRFRRKHVCLPLCLSISFFFHLLSGIFSNDLRELKVACNPGLRHLIQLKVFFLSSGINFYSEGHIDIF